MAGTLCALVSVGTLMATAAPASAAPLQDFTLIKNGGSQVAVAQGVVQSGIGTFVSNGATSETLTFANGTVEMNQTVGTHHETLDIRSCRSTIIETGTFGFSKQAGQITFGGTGTYSLAGTRQAIKVPGGCALVEPDLTQYSLTAHATEVHAVL